MIKVTKNNLGAALIVSAVLVGSSYAAGGGEHHTKTMYDIRHFYLHFLIFSVVIFQLLKKPFRQAFQGWCERIAAQVESGALRFEQAQEELQRAQGKMATLPQAVAELTERIKKEGDAESNEAIADVTEIVAKLRKRAQDAIETEDLLSTKEYQRTLTEKAMEEATRHLTSKSSVTTDAKRREEALVGLGRFGILQ